MYFVWNTVSFLSCSFYGTTVHFRDVTVARLRQFKLAAEWHRPWKCTEIICASRPNFLGKLVCVCVSLCGVLACMHVCMYACNLGMFVGGT